jgi:hypothetical protein
MELAYLVGDPIEVDLKTLNSQGPVRVKLACRDAKKISGETKFFFNGEGYTIRWEPEIQSGSDEGSKSTKFDRQRDREEDEFDEEEERDRDPLARQDPFYSSAKIGWSSQSNAGKSAGGPGKQTDTNFGSSKKGKSSEIPTGQENPFFTTQVGNNTIEDGKKASEGGSGQGKLGAE